MNVGAKGIAGIVGLVLLIGLSFMAGRGFSQGEAPGSSKERFARSVFLVHEVLDPRSLYVGRKISVFGILGITRSADESIVRLMPYEGIDSYNLGTTIGWITLRIDIQPNNVLELCVGGFVVVHGTLGHIDGRPAMSISDPGEGIVNYSNGKVDFCSVNGSNGKSANE